MKIAALLLSFGLLASPALAQNEAPSNDTIIAGTDLTYPETDHDCDRHFDSGDFQGALPLCLQSAMDYRAMFDGLEAKEPQLTADRLRYNEAYTRMEVAIAYMQTETPDAGHDYAVQAYKLFRNVTDPYYAKIAPIIGWKKSERHGFHIEQLTEKQQAEIHEALTPGQLHLGGAFLHIMQTANKIYPDVCPEINDLTNAADNKSGT